MGLDNLRDKQYYLIHGTHDDNVHYQQSMLLSAALEEKDILFRQQSYPDQDHSIGDYRKHLYHSLSHFFTSDCFKIHSHLICLALIVGLAMSLERKLIIFKLDSPTY